jgi:hypothetical protein
VQHRRVVTTYGVTTYGVVRGGGAGISIVMEPADRSVRGAANAARVARRPLVAANCDRWMQHVADALQHVHAQGVCHLDVKPDNVLLFGDGGGDGGGDAKLADFGISGRCDARGLLCEPRRGGRGTPHYMAPEQWGDAATVGRAADVFAFGVVLFELVTGILPFEWLLPDGGVDAQEDTFAAIEDAASHGRRQYHGDAAAAFFDASPRTQLAVACMAEDPAARPTMRAVLKRLAAPCGVPPSAPGEGPRSPVPGPQPAPRVAAGGAFYRPIAGTTAGVVITQLERRAVAVTDVQFDRVTECVARDVLRAVATHCSALTRLDASDCAAVTDDDIAAVAQHCPRLSILDVAGCSLLTDAGLATVALQCPELTHLYVSRCAWLTDAGLVAVAQHCQRLTHLEAAGCSAVSDAGVGAVAQHCRALAYLGVQGCAVRDAAAYAPGAKRSGEAFSTHIGRNT